MPYEQVIELYDEAESPKEVVVHPGGFHSAPLMPGNLRERWMVWLSLMPFALYSYLSAISVNGR
ncbi:MAG: hypothetical protein Q7T05_08630 [Dehalococcoidia bacterium]|nr:hypothetical protein [Dehalococcoidia bacterium]